MSEIGIVEPSRVADGVQESSAGPAGDDQGRSFRGALRAATPYVLVAPAAIYLLVFMAYPLVKGLQLSVTQTSLLAPGRGQFTGADNYSSLVGEDGFWRSVWITGVYSAASVIGALVLGLAAALVMNLPLRGKTAVRSFVTLPWAAPPIAVALVFVWMFNNQYGVVNYLLSKLGVIDSYQNWLDSEGFAMVSLVSVTVWMSFPICALILLAALQSIPAELYEASQVDGASALNRFKNVTLPGVRPTLYVVTLFLTIWAVRRFDIIWVMTQGGPVKSTTTLVVNLYREAFKNQDLGVASTIGVFGFILSTLLTVIYFIANRRSERRAGGVG
jgi:multiple sugar transport system permease protein